MKLVEKDSPISRSDLTQLALTRFGDMIKAVVDISKRTMVVDADLHADEEALLLQIKIHDTVNHLVTE